MKIRQGFVSNSSSSSFIVINSDKIEEAKDYLDEHRIGYYVFKNVLYTSYICDWRQSELEDFPKYFEEYYPGGHGYPYNDEDFVEIETDYDSVWILRENLTDEDLIELGQAPYHISSKLYFICKNYFEKNDPEIRDAFIADLKNAMEGDYED